MIKVGHTLVQVYIKKECVRERGTFARRLCETSRCVRFRNLQYQGGFRNLQNCKAVPRRVLVFKAHRLLYHSTLGLRVKQEKKKEPAKPRGGQEPTEPMGVQEPTEPMGVQEPAEPRGRFRNLRNQDGFFFFFSSLFLSSLELSDTKVYEP